MKLSCVAVVGALLLVTGCVRKGYPVDAPAVDDVEIRGAEVVDPDELLSGLATAESPRFLGIWDGVVFDYEVFDEQLLERDLERVERFYRARGYYDAKVIAARVIPAGKHHVRVQIQVREGTPVKVARFTTAGLERVDIDTATAALRRIQLRVGKPFDEKEYDASKKGLVAALADNGYAFARVTGKVSVDLAHHSALVEFAVEPGKKARYGPVRIVGLEQIPEGPVRDNLELEPGKEYSRAEVEDARTALVNLGVFGTVDVRQDLSNPESGIVPITVVAQEAPMRTLRLGGGSRFDVLEWEAHLAIGWEHRNFLGGMRRFSIDTRPGLVFFPTRIDNFEAPREVLPKNRIRAELRQPSFLEGRTTGLLAGEFNVYPVLYPGLGETPGENVIGYQEVKAQAGVERAFFEHHLYMTLSYNWQANMPFAYIGDNPLETAFVSYPDLSAILDFRDDPIEPHKGIFVANTLQVAGHGFGGDASDVKEQPEIRTYVPISKTVTFATRVTVGFLFPSNYGDTLRNPNISPTDPAALRDQQLLLLRAFYSGGPNSNRGYPFRGVGPQGPLGFLLPATVVCGNSEAPECLRPTGGLTLWEASAETRFPILGPLRAAIFVDASDLVREVGSIRFNYPHVSPGFGLRYATPVGPVRLDVGYRLPFAQQIGKDELSRREGTPSTVLGLPIAVHFGLGEAF